MRRRGNELKVEIRGKTNRFWHPIRYAGREREVRELFCIYSAPTSTGTVLGISNKINTINQLPDLADLTF